MYKIQVDGMVKDVIYSLFVRPRRFKFACRFLRNVGGTKFLGLDGGGRARGGGGGGGGGGGARGPFLGGGGGPFLGGVGGHPFLLLHRNTTVLHNLITFSAFLTRRPNA